MPTKAELLNTVVSLGIASATDAASMTKQQLADAIAGADIKPMETEPTGGRPGKRGEGNDKPSGTGEAQVAVGHIVIVMDAETGEPVGFAYVIAMDEEGTITLKMSDGQEITAKLADQGQSFSNTGIALGDIVATGNTFHAVRGIGEQELVVTTYTNEMLTHSDPEDGGMAMTSFDVQLDESQDWESPEKVVQLDQLTGHWSLQPHATFELTQEGADYLNKIRAIVDPERPPFSPNEPIGIQNMQLSGDRPRADQNSVLVSEDLLTTMGVLPGLAHPEWVMGRKAPARRNEWRTPAFANLPLTPTNTLGIVGSYGPSIAPYPKDHPMFNTGAVMRNVWTKYNHENFGTENEREGNLMLALDNLSVPLEFFESRQPEECQSDSQNQSAGDGQGDRTKEDMMENSRRTLADMKGTPDQPQKKSVSSEKLREAVENVMGDTEAMNTAVEKVIEEKREELRDLLGINKDLETLGDQMLDDIADAFKAYEREQEAWRKAVEQKVTSKVVFDIPEFPEITIENPHAQFEHLVFNAVLRLPTLLVGPSGSGKTTAARRLAEMLGLPFGYVALGPTQTEAKFAGYPDAQGMFVPTEFYLRYRYGGVMLLDEMDAGNPSVLVWINGAIQNKLAAFPRGFMTQLERDGHHKDAKELRDSGGMITMHPDCVIVASANTFGRGADLVYQGRNALDGATLKRFKVLVWDYDELLERKLAGDDLWTSFVQEVRASVNDCEMQHIVSPVDSIDGARMIAAGADWHMVAQQTVFAGLKEADIKKILNEKTHKTTINSLRKKLNQRQEKGEVREDA